MHIRLFLISVISIAVTAEVSAQAPLLACIGGPGKDSFNITLRATCSENNGSAKSPSNSITGWNNESGANTVCSHSNLTGQGNSSAKLDCVSGTTGEFRLQVETSVQALAGYHLNGSCKPGGNYCGASAAAEGAAEATFTVVPGQVGAWCVAILGRSGERKATRGYPTSNQFKEFTSAPTQNSVELLRPDGLRLGVSGGARYPINVGGVWRIRFLLAEAHTSNAAENSGRITLKQDLRAQFLTANADGTCPPASKP